MVKGQGREATLLGTPAAGGASDDGFPAEITVTSFDAESGRMGMRFEMCGEAREVTMVIPPGTFRDAARKLGCRCLDSDK